jgi:hypothetical protein
VNAQPSARRQQRLPAPIQKQVDEANALLKELNTKPGDAPAAAAAPTTADPPVTPPAPTSADPPIAPPQPTSADPPIAPPQPTSAPPAEDWQRMFQEKDQQYKVLKGKYDKEIPELRVLLTEAQEKNRQDEVLIKQLNDRLQNNAPVAATKPNGKTSITEKEREEYGEEFFQVVAKQAREIAEAEMAPMRAELERLRNSDKSKEQLAAETARHQMISLLDERLPNWKAQNQDQNFIDWLENPDVFSGQKRRELLTHAWNSNDAARVLRFFQAFQEDAAPAPAPAARTPSVDPAALVAPGTPRNAGTTAAPGGSDRIYTQQEIADHYANVRRGKVSAEDRVRFDREITRAAAEGRVR